MLPSSVISTLYHFLFYGIFSPCSAEANNAKNGCSIDGHSIHCLGASGEFLPTVGTNHIRNMYISDCDMSSLTYTSFTEYPEVTNIEIRQTYISIPQQNHLFKLLRNLKNLTIEHGDLGEEVFATYVMNESLERLSLRGNHIAYISRRLIANQSHLKELDVSANGATRMEDNFVGHTKELRWIDLSNNRLCGGSSGVASLSPEHCIVCHPGLFLVRCSQADVRACADGLPLDRLWWRSPTLQVHLQGNPLCDSIMAPPTSFRSEPYLGDWTCKVTSKNCYLHRRRLLFLIEACGTDLMTSEKNSRDGDMVTPEGRSSQDSDDEFNSFSDGKKETEGETERNEHAKWEDDMERSENENTSQKLATAHDHGLNSGITMVILYCLGISICVVGLGAMWKMYRKEWCGNGSEGDVADPPCTCGQQSNYRKGYFQDNPKDYTTLRHDKALHTVRLQPHLKDVPEYLVPENLQPLVDIEPTSHQEKKYTPKVSTTKQRYLIPDKSDLDKTPGDEKRNPRLNGDQSLQPELFPSLLLDTTIRQKLDSIAKNIKDMKENEGYEGK